MTLDSLDYTGFSRQYKLRQLLKNLDIASPHGQVILMHDGGRGGETTARLLDRLLAESSAMGWRTTPLTNILDVGG